MSFYCLLSISLALAFGVLMSFHLYLLLWVRAGTYDWMMQEREDYNARSRAAKKQYESAHRIKKFDDGRKEGVITATGDIEFAARHHSDSESSINNDDAWSASGEEVESFMSSRTTEELDDPCKEDILVQLQEVQGIILILVCRNARWIYLCLANQSQWALLYRISLAMVPLKRAKIYDCYSIYRQTK